MGVEDYKKYHEYRNHDMSRREIQLPEYFINILPENKNIAMLDIGCGNGNILYALKLKGYTNLYGIDLDEDAVECCKKQGILCEKTDIFDFCWDGNKFDFIMMNHVLEHLPKEKIIAVLCYIKDTLLADNGQLFIRVPNAQAYIGCYWAYEDFTHNLLFTAGSLLYVLRCAGFNTIKLVDQYGIENGKKMFRPVKKAFICLYEKRVDFWNYILGDSFHKASPRVYTWELKMLVVK